MIDKLLDKLNEIRKKNNLKNLEWSIQLINVANKDVKEIALTNKYAENNYPENFYKYETQYYNAKDEHEVFNELINDNKTKSFLLNKNFSHFGVAFKNKHWVLYFGHLYAIEKIDVNLLFKLTNEERMKNNRKKLELNK